MDTLWIQWESCKDGNKMLQNSCVDVKEIMQKMKMHFTHTTHSIARYLLWKDDWLAGCLSVTCWYCVKMAKPILKLSTNW